MDRSSRPTPAGFTAMLVFFWVAMPVAAQNGFHMSYCSSQNTGSTDVSTDDWMSNGLCKDRCDAQGTYAFAVLKWKECYCSNYIPQKQEDTSDCQVKCPGYPSEQCGNEDEGLYAYIDLGNAPSGTVGGSKPTSANKPTASSTLQTSAKPDPQTSTQVITESGIVITRTIVTSPTGAEANLTEGRKGGSNNTGAIVGGVVGGLALLAIIVGAVLFFLWKRRRQQRQDQDPDEPSGVQRNTSTMSRSGLLGGRSEKQPGSNPQYPPAIAPINTRQSRNLDSESISPISASDRRSSRPYIFDQRLNPNAIMVLDNTSRGSIASMDDSQDYGRQLKIRNPDPNAERW